MGNESLGKDSGGFWEEIVQNAHVDKPISKASPSEKETSFSQFGSFYVLNCAVPFEFVLR